MRSEGCGSGSPGYPPGKRKRGARRPPEDGYRSSLPHSEIKRRKKSVGLDLSCHGETPGRQKKKGEDLEAGRNNQVFLDTFLLSDCSRLFVSWINYLHRRRRQSSRELQQRNVLLAGPMF